MADQFQQLLARMDQLTTALHGQAEQPQHSGPRPRGPPPPTFAGDRTESVDNFLFRLETYLAFNNVHDPQQRLLLAITCLRDHALTWFRSLTEQPDDLDGLFDRLSSTFRDVDEQRELRQHLRRLRQTSSVQEYVQDFRRVMVRVDDMSTLDRIEAFVHGLKPRTCREVSFHAPSTLEEAYRLALRYDRNYQASTFSAPRPPRQAWTPPAPSPYAMDVDAVGTRPASGLRRLTDQERDELRRRGACFRCRQDGHMARDCPLNGRPAPPPPGAPAGPGPKNGQRQ